MGAGELARQYEWGTCKSQPNVLKRLDSEGAAGAGLTAVDFRAGLALLALLPMSPADVLLILKGLARGTLVQFDRGDLEKLRQFIREHHETFADMGEVLAELEETETAYRNSLIDVTHNHVKLLYSRHLWNTIFDSTVTCWRVRNIIDEAREAKLRRSKILTALFALVALTGVLSLAAAGALLAVMVSHGAAWWAAAGAAAAIALAGSAAGKLLQRLWGQSCYRRHYATMLTSRGYFKRAMRGRMAEALIAWHRRGRINADGARRLSGRLGRFLLHIPLSVLPAWLHRSCTDAEFLRLKLHYIFVRPVRLYFNSAAREQWLRDMLTEGKRTGTLSAEDARIIESRIAEPFIQKYLKSLAVHVCTLPVTQVVSLAVALVYVVQHPQLSAREAWTAAILILAAFQITPISPGSLVRGLYVLLLVIRERNFKDYNIAVFLGFFKYVGYLAFPIQMAQHYPALARFMAGHWATGAVHVVPVFGEKGALLEHAVFDLFYNYPLTVRRRMRLRAQARASVKRRYWHTAPCVLGVVALLAMLDWLRAGMAGQLPTLRVEAALPVLLGGAALTRWAGGGTVGQRVRLAVLCGALIAVLSAAMNLAIIGWIMGDAACVIQSATGDGLAKFAASSTAWRAFWFIILTVLGVLAAEITARPVSETGRGEG
ncbi:MAG: hypothetical protein J7M14_02805, partial [Planctomycetes bacterium]|nr:hypothetical protein [Planctomycetota bacterium]